MNSSRDIVVLERRIKLVVLHLPRVYFQQQLNQCQVISALFTTINPELEVVMCGSRLVYQQDLRDLIRSLTAAARKFGEHVLTQLCSLACTQTDDQIIAVEGEMPINCDSSSQRSTAQVPEQALTSIMRLKSYRCYLRQKQVFVNSEPTPLVHSGSVIPVHAKCCLFECSERNFGNEAEENTKSSCHHVRIMAETQLYGSYSSFQLKTSLQLLLKHSKVATLSLGGHTISAFKKFDPSSASNIICFSDKEIPVWFRNEMSYQMSSRSRVGIKLPPRLLEDRNWRGLGVCVAFEVHDQIATTSPGPVKLLCHLRAKDNYCLNPIPMCSITEERYKSLHLGRFIWLTYIPRILLTELNVVSDVEARIYVSCRGLRVEKCGIRLLYRQEEVEFEEIIRECWTSFFDNLSFIRQLVEADDQNDQLWTRHEPPMLEGHIKVFDPDLIYNAIPHSNEIPEWFGRGIDPWPDCWSWRFQLPPSLNGTNWIGLAICASYLISRDYLLESISCPFILKLETRNNGLSSSHRYQMSNEESEFLKHCDHIGRNVAGEFIWLSYIPRRWFLHQLNDESALNVSVTRMWWKPEKISLRFLYAHEGEEFKQLCCSLHGSPPQQ
ncbi:PREDICTED: uncharacterized protein LOC101309295 isoform X2 [Fragaria vesca subsp. vesca]|uniref:uncharacterized protein LOC101309295 isoform X2 n=1 Tax=Fragaria vesca subsp. vesca TaxID=101020 RepID=UPI0002C315DD|nr:PREDICTED: uncharacterized protein LOC101309295 isoform X2 [Fragaria vesca subsp. vesca]